MHELSIITNVVDSLYDFFETESKPVTKVKSVTLSVGAVSGVVPHYLTDAWSWFTKNDDLFRDSKLNIEIIHAYTTCLDCGKEYDTITYAKVCPHCHSENTVLKQGNELLIKEVEVA
ncbi:MAG: hydrogenase maturation nickel metallochaperone HypA [Bacilli bacterium]|nr:hydrogenase maturation nickel metallochaperone HypA [Bacilli bacterium]